MNVTTVIKKPILNIVIACLLLLAGSYANSVKRGRNEGTLSIPASNVMGTGNITGYTGIHGLLTGKKAEINSLVGAQIGIAGILQFNAQTSFINFQRFGPTEMHLQITMPGNDKIRFFGLGILADLFLSTSIDTIGGDADITKPNYDPYPLASMVIDLDWIARPKQLPLKTYLYASLLDDAKLLYEFKQIAVRAGMEMKLYRHSLFVDAGVALYKERNPGPGISASFNQMYGWIGPGIRYRFLRRFSLLGNLRWTFFTDTEQRGSLDPEKLSMTIKLEAPLIIRETNTEAIRTLVFVEKKKKEEVTEQFSTEAQKEKNLLGKFKNVLLELDEGEGTFDYQKEQENLILRREEIKRNMEKIEELLKDDEKNE